MTEPREIYCVGCEKDVPARLTTGAEIYPHRNDLAALSFYICDACKNYVGCHKGRHQPPNPLGNIPTAELRRARGYIHNLLDPLWQTDRSRRGQLYAEISKRIGRQYHTAEIKSVEEARQIYAIIKELAA